eukprot:Phypoly_transcript_04596.p1 GENE.Phypoly_transcript_04596~~Phypoly_transcript_04596.p1  ORF type:complete len:517 (+),score=40.15 Phypoly_transcript_04596:553-2103(+)
MTSRNTLLHQCIKWTCSNFSHVLHNRPDYFPSLPEDVKDKLLSHLLRTKTLTKEYLIVFLSSSRLHLALDVDDGAWLQPECFSTIATHCPGLQSLSLAYCTQLNTKELTEVVKACKNLNALTLRGCSLLDDPSLHVIADNCQNLVYLDVFDVNKITNAGVQYLCKSETAMKLEFLSLGNCKKIGNAAMDSLALLPNLQELNLYTCPLLNSNGLVSLASGPAGKSLRALDISHCGGILDQGLITIASMTQLRTLQMAGMMRITAEGVTAVAHQCTLLESLSINKCKQLNNDSVVAILTHSKNLSVLDLAFLDQVTDEAFVNMPSMPSLVTLDMKGMHRITDATVKKVALNTPNLQVWILWKCSNITDEGVTAIGNNCHLLTHIQLTDCSRITDKGVQELALGCPLLTTILLGGWATISDEGIKVLSTHCKSLRTIDLGGLVSITNHSLRYLGESCPNLYSVTLYDCKSVTEDGIHNLVKSSPTLQRLDMGGKTGMTPQQIAQITSHYKNRYLEVAFF